MAVLRDGRELRVFGVAADGERFIEVVVVVE
jgi:hypothetical protein